MDRIKLVKVSCDQATSFFLQDRHSRYSVAMKYKPLASKTRLTVLYIPHAVSGKPRWRQLGCEQSSLYDHKQ